MNTLRSAGKKVSAVWTTFRGLRLRTKIIAVAVISAIAFVGFRQAAAANRQPQYLTEAAKRADITAIVSETGNMETSGETDVFSTSTGIVEQLYVKDGDAVSVGQNLFRVKSTATDMEKAAAYATYQNAVSALTTAKQSKQSLDAAMWTAHKALLDARNTQNYKNDYTKNPATNKDYTELEKDSINVSEVQAEKNFRSAEQKYVESDVAISAAQAQVSSAWLSYQNTQDVVIRAPASGTVANLAVRQGDRVTGVTPSSVTAVSASATVTPVLTLADLTKYTVKLALNEVDIPKVREGQPAKLTLDAFPGRKFEGKVTHVDAIGTNTGGVITYNVVVEITNPADTIKPAMTVNVDIEVNHARNALTVPNGAIKPYKGAKAVQVVNPKTKAADYVPVEVGIKSPERTEIKNGITDGTMVITGTKNGAVKAETK